MGFIMKKYNPGQDNADTKYSNYINIQMYNYAAYFTS
jgi:hypothetical protein